MAWGEFPMIIHRQLSMRGFFTYEITLKKTNLTALLTRSVRGYVCVMCGRCDLQLIYAKFLPKPCSTTHLFQKTHKETMQTRRPTSALTAAYANVLLL